MEGIFMIAEDVKAAARDFARESLAKGFIWEALHEYVDENGTPLYWKIRLKHPETKEKWIRPMCLNGHGYEPRKPDFTTGAPLYMLADIVARPEAVLWITEGEWAADRLNKKFRQLGVYGEHIASTSGGATSAGGANWKCLQGREVRIWPDNDGPGLKYAQDVADCLRALHCRVRHLDIAKLSLAEHGDAVDWLEVNPEATLDDLLGLSAAEPVAGQQETDADDSPGGPPRIDPRAFHGPLEEIVDLATKNSEAAGVAVAANVIALFSATIGRVPYMWIGDGKNHARPFFLIVGRSAKSRKGTAEALPRRLFKKVDELLRDRVPDYVPLEIHGGGLSSGEGIAHALRDASETTGKDDSPKDPGVPDKRLLVVEPEFAGALAAMRRETSTLSATIRNLWDGRDLAPMTKNNRTRASNPHGVLIGHITGQELIEKIRQLEISNGLLNRFLFLHVQRHQLVPR